MHGFLAVHATVSEKTAALTAMQAATAQCLENAIWEEADYLVVCTVREVMVFPPSVHAGWGGARRLPGGGGDRLRVCETSVSSETVVWTAQKPLTFPETVPETVVKPDVFSETVAFLFEVHIEYLTLIRTQRSPNT